MNVQFRGLVIAVALVSCLVVMVYAQPSTAEPQTTTQPVEVPITQVPGTAPTVSEGRPSQSAVPVTEVPSPAAPTHAPEQIMWALVASYVLRFITKKGWLKVLNEESATSVKALFGFLVAATTAAGIHFAVSGSVFDGGGAAITITGVSWDALKDIGWQWASQQAWFDLVVKEKTV